MKSPYSDKVQIDNESLDKLIEMNAAEDPLLISPEGLPDSKQIVLFTNDLSWLIARVVAAEAKVKELELELELNSPPF